MLVQVKWANDGYDYVEESLLDYLIEAGSVARFLRSSGWVTIGVDPIRSNTSKHVYIGAERRALNLIG